jgi:hypothetical protein
MLSRCRTRLLHVWIKTRTCVRDAHGSPLTRFRWAIEQESLILAEIAATETGYLSLYDALRLTDLYAPVRVIRS